MEIKKYKKEVELLTAWVKEAGEIIKNTKMEVSDKGTNTDLVTNLDYAIEKFLISKFNEHFPELSAVSEEFNADASLQENCFVIDPIDGTVNFANGLPGWAIQVAIVYGGELAVSVIYMPPTNELFVAAKGEGAYLNGEKIHVNSNPVNKCLFTLDAGSRLNKGKMIEELKEFTRHHRSIGSAAASFSYVAKGALGATCLLKYSLWDFMPGLLMVKEAGAAVFDNKNKFVLVANKSETLEVFKKVILENWKDK